MSSEKRGIEQDDNTIPEKHNAGQDDSDTIPEKRDVEQDDNTIPEKHNAGQDDSDTIPEKRDVEQDDNTIPEKHNAGQDDSDTIPEKRDVEQDDNTIPEKHNAGQDGNSMVSAGKSTFNGLVIGIIILVGVAAFFAGTYASSLNSEQVSAEDLNEAIARLELKLLQNQLPANQMAKPVKISADNDPTIGEADAPITIIEFSDFQCPFCARFNSQTLPLILDEYINEGKVRLVFRDFPIQNIHPNALPASIAAECANDQGKFKEMHDMLFEKQGEWSGAGTEDVLSVFGQYASDIQIDQAIFETCMTSGEYIPEIRKDLEDGRDYGVTGTPGFFIGNDEIGYVMIKGAQPFESFKKIIDAQLGA